MSIYSFRISKPKFYVYTYLRSKTSKNGPINSPYYIGKGHGRRIYGPHGRIPVPKDAAFIQIIAENMYEHDAHQAEMLLIKQYGRFNIKTGCLHNQTDGGEGISGYNHTDEAKLAMSISKLGENNPAFNKPWSKERKESYSKQQTGKPGKPMSDEQKLAQSIRFTGEGNPNFGRIQPQEEKDRRNKKLKGQKRSEEFRQGKMGNKNPMFGKPCSSYNKAMTKLKNSGSNNPLNKPHNQKICEHCFKSVNKSHYTRWHGNKCKYFLVYMQEYC